MTCTRYRSRHDKTPTDSQIDSPIILKCLALLGLRRLWKLKRSQYRYNVHISEQKIGRSKTEVFFKTQSTGGHTDFLCWQDQGFREGLHLLIYISDYGLLGM